MTPPTCYGCRKAISRVVDFDTEDPVLNQHAGLYCAICLARAVGQRAKELNQLCPSSA